MFKKTLVGLAVAGLAAVSGSAMAGVSISTAGGTVNGVTQLDWAPSNVLALGGQTAVNNFITAKANFFTSGAFFALTPAQQQDALINGVDKYVTCSNCGFTAYAQGKLGGFRDASNNLIQNTGLGSKYEVTYVIGFDEHVIGASSNSATFAFGSSSDKPINYFRMYYDTSKDSSDLAGTGFENGALIFEGKVTPKDGVYTSSFTNLTSNTSPGVALDGFNGVSAGWAGYNSVQGAGTTSALDLIVTPFTINQDYNFFLSLITQFELTNLSANLEFNVVDPSLSFETAGVANTRTEISTMNGRNGNSVLFQTDPNSPINGVPEPGSIALLSAAALAAGVVRRRKA